MKIPLSWLKDFVDIDLGLPELAHRLTLAGLEVEEIRYVGLPLPEAFTQGKAGRKRHVETVVSGLAWDAEKIVVGEVREVMPHPDADRLVLCRLFDGEGEHTVLTGAPNLFPYLNQGPLNPPLKVAYAHEGALLYDGHKPGWELTTLKRAKIRGVESTSMVCSEKELGISEEHEGVILLDEDAPSGRPLAEYMGDAVLDISITPNLARDANVLGVAREIAALTGAPLREPDYEVASSGPAIEGRASVEIREPDLNPRFVMGLVEAVTIGPSPYRVQRRLRLAGVRPINNVVDATNYVMLELGEPLHAFDYDVLVRRAGGAAPRLITRRAKPGERLTTLDEVERTLDDFTELVADAAGPLSIAGVIGGADSEVSESTTNVLLEGAAWNLINIRQTLSAQHIASEAAYRFSRGVHPAMAARGVRRGLALMHALAGGEVAEGLIDEYPRPPEAPVVEITTADVRRWLGLELPAAEIADLLRRLEFEVTIEGEALCVTPPDHRLDIGEGVVGMADLTEEIARLYGYDRVPETLIADELPPQYGNRALELEERARDLLVNLGLQEVVNYRMTTPEREARRLAPQAEPDARPYVTLLNPISSDRAVMRHSLLASVLEAGERNARVAQRLALFEIGPVFLPAGEGELPEEPTRLAALMTGPRRPPDWVGSDPTPMDFYDLKGVVDALLAGLHVEDARFEPGEHTSMHPGKCARVLAGERELGTVGALHPIVAERYGLAEHDVLVASFDLEALLDLVPERFPLRPVPVYPPVLEDIAVIVGEGVPAADVQAAILAAGGDLLSEARLFDIYRGEQVGAGKKSLAYSLVYQALDRTLTDEEVAAVRERIIAGLARELDASLRA